MMKQTGMESDTLYLPAEIVTNILKRLPVKSLIRFQCVCKDWNVLIKIPSFILDHLQQSSHQNPRFLLECNRSYSPLDRGRLRLLDCRMQDREFQTAPLMDSLKGAKIVCSCNGLLCVEIYQHNKSPPSLLLWNPATTEVRHVPRTRTDCFYFDNWVTGFGFSPILNDYKILRTYSHFYDVVNRVEVFALSRGSWKGIDIGNLKGVKLNSETVTANGAIFGFGVLVAEEEGEDGVEVIVSFDIAKEVFTLIPMPNLGYNSGDKKLTVYENKLVLLHDIRNVDDQRSDMIDLWIMEEGTGAFVERCSWAKMYTSGSYLSTLDPVTIWRNHIVFKPSGYCNGKGKNALHLMNLTTNEVERFVIPHCGLIFSIYNYVESLVPVGNNYIEESCS